MKRQKYVKYSKEKKKGLSENSTVELPNEWSGTALAPSTVARNVGCI
jgi:hypothetical protein